MRARSSRSARHKDDLEHEHETNKELDTKEAENPGSVDWGKISQMRGPSQHTAEPGRLGANMDVGYCYRLLSSAISEMCVSTQPLRKRLSLCLYKSPFIALPPDVLPDELREQFLEIKEALPGRIRTDLEHYPDAIDRMRQSDVRQLIGKILSLHEGLAREYYKRAFRVSGVQVRKSRLEEPDLSGVLLGLGLKKKDSQKKELAKRR